MKLDLHVYIHADEDRILSELRELTQLINRRFNTMAAELDDLKLKVTAIVDASESAIVLLNGLKQKLDEAIASGNPAALTELSATLGAETQKLADAIVANTPAAPV